jgi:hypothetical protein
MHTNATPIMARPANVWTPMLEDISSGCKMTSGKSAPKAAQEPKIMLQRRGTLRCQYQNEAIV